MKYTTIFIFIFAIFFFPSIVLGAMQLDVPFTSQSPDGNWKQPWQDACEEASIFMVNRLYIKKNILSPEDAKKGIGEILL